MTLDRIAEEAGVSKGGLLYHFPSKDELIVALLTHFGQKLQAAISERVEKDPNPSRRWVRAAVDIVFGQEGTGHSMVDNEFGQFFLTLAAAASVNRKLIDPMKPLLQSQLALLANEPDGLEQLRLWLAVDGLMAWQMFGLISVGDELFARLVSSIREQVCVKN